MFLPMRLSLKWRAIGVVALLALWNVSTWTKIFSSLSESYSSNPGMSILSELQEVHSKNQLRPHPFAGARHPDGAYGYIADPTALRRHMLGLYRHHHLSEQQRLESNKDHRKDIHSLYTFLPFVNRSGFDSRTYGEVCNTPPGRGIEVFAYDMLMERIQVNAPEPIPLNVTNTKLFKVDTVPVPPPHDANRITGPKSRILCIIYTHKGSKRQLEAITHTWGWRCDGFLAASTVTQMDHPDEPGFGSIDLAIQGPNIYSNMWQKTRSIIGYIYLNYLQDFEYFHICGDDTYVIVENMRNFLSSVEQQHRISPASTKAAKSKRFSQMKDSVGNRTHDNVPLYFGRAHPARDKSGVYSTVYADGGPGYVLNRAAVKEYVEKVVGQCYANFSSSSEDCVIAACLKSVGIQIRASNDVDKQGRHRFFVSDPNHVVRNGWAERPISVLDVRENIGHKVGRDAVSTQAVAFHWLRYLPHMKRIHAILYRSCPQGTVLGDALWEFDKNHVPTKSGDLANIERQQRQTQ